MAARVRHVDIINCNVGASIPFAEALAASRVRGLRVETLQFNDDGKSLSWSYEQVAKQLPSMPCLEEFAFKETNRSPRAATAFARMAARCMHLKRLTIDTQSHFATFDQALARCIESNQTLKYIGFLGGSFKNEAKDFPCFVEAMKTNVSLQYFDCERSYRVRSAYSTSELSLQRNVDIICRLNRSGRAYVKSDPGNKAVSQSVLAAVADDLDCIFFHLRENPIICGKGALTKAHGKKRTAQEAELTLPDEDDTRFSA